MSYKPDDKDWMAYLYGELEGEEKERFEQYLFENPDARIELQKFQGVRGLLGAVKDKEVIAPPLVLTNDKRNFIWDAPYFKTIVSIAASLLVVILFAKLTGLRISSSDNEFTIGFGQPKVEEVAPQTFVAAQTLTEDEVQKMINASLEKNNDLFQESLKRNEDKVAESVKKNLAVNSERIDHLVRQASIASQDQIQQYIAGLQAQNMTAVKDYFQLTSTEQKTYIENMLVDFAQYLQQQRNSDLEVVQMKLNDLEQNTDVFKQETEQILTSIISNVGTKPGREIRN